MVKKIVQFMLIFLLPAAAQSQPVSVLNSLHNKLSIAQTDTARAQTLLELGVYYQESNRDSSLHYAEAFIALTRKMKQPLLSAAGLILKAYTVYHKGDLLSAFKFINQDIEVFSDKENSKEQWIPALFGIRYSPEQFRLFCLSNCYTQLGHIYYGAGNKDKAKEYYREALKVATSIDNNLGLASGYMLLGELYFQEKKMDSAMLYSLSALPYAMKSDRSIIGSITHDIGDIYFYKGQLDSARLYYWKALAISKEEQFILTEINVCLSLGMYYEKAGMADSILYYGEDAYHLADGFKQNNYKSRAAALIAKAWKMKANMDSAYTYLHLSKAIGDSNSLDKERTRSGFQSYNFDEQIRIEKEARENIQYRNNVRTIALVAGLALLSLLVFVFYKNNRQKQKANKVLEGTLANLKATQSQLIQSEKMASLGELTAGIAHEIQNPLNFVNNFSEVNAELIDEAGEEISKGNIEEARNILHDIKDNEQKINHHGKRADAIVKGMLQHSRSSNGKKEATDVNALCDEYLRLSYHGLRAKDKTFNAALKTDFDSSIEKINIIPQDIGRVVMNLLTNAFYAVNEKSLSLGTTPTAAKYEPTVSISTKKINNKVEITVSDNGNGIPIDIKEKIFQPFFTTKPTGQGTGLGLSLSYDIITKGHGGELKVETNEGEGSTFHIKLPILKDE